jgi:Flp pilus assembly protein TadG
MMSKQKSIWKKPAIRQAFQRLMFGEDGAVLVEATIIAPILVVMSIYTADFGLLFYYKMEMQNGAQAGAQWAVANGTYNFSSIQAAAQNATQVSGVTFTPSTFCGCLTAGTAGPPPVPPAVTSITTTTCTPNSTTNPSCSTGVTGTYVTVTATATPAPLAPYGLLSSSPTLSATATARIQ